MNDLHIALEEQSTQQHEIILNKILQKKLQKSADRLESLKCLNEAVSKSQTIAEIVWFVLQMDLEKTMARYDNTEDLINESQECQKRIQLMKNLENRNENIVSELNQYFLSKISEVFGNCKSWKTSKGCLLEFEKFNRLLKYSQTTLVNGNHYTSLNDLMNKVQESIAIIEPAVNESPVRKPIMENMKFINEIFNTEMDILKMEEMYKSVREEFQKMASNMVIYSNLKLWRKKHCSLNFFLRMIKSGNLINCCGFGF